MSTLAVFVAYACIRGSQEINRKYHEWKSNKKDK